jgi:hypothetical protein
MSRRSAYRAASGTSFAHTADMSSRPREMRTIHESVDPKRLNTLGEKIRECLDSPEHPTTLPVVVGFDETGSMGHAPRLLQQKLATLKGATLRMGLDDAQLCFAAYGDAQNDEVAPCQVGQFESGLEMEEWLNNLYLEGMGGGNKGETAGLLLWFLANFSRLDSLTKRGKKGYLILTGDECPLLKVTREEIKRYIDENVQADVRIEDVVEQAKKSYNIFFFLVDNGAARQQGSLKVWSKLLGQNNVIVVQDLDSISEQIALLLAQEEALVDSLASGVAMLLAEGANPDDARAASTALAHRNPNQRVVKATSSGTLPIPTASGGVVERL